MPRYNLLFITIDSWNRNFVGCYNENAKAEGLTPHLDAFSEKCVLFSSAFSSSVKTSASVLSILSGCCPCKYGDWFSSVSKDRVMISEILHKNGYSTYGFTSNPCTSSLRGYNRGFGVFRDDNVLKNIKGRTLKIFLSLKALFKNPYSSADKVNSQVLRHLDKNRTPFFVNVHYMDMHGPYISRGGWQFRNRISAGKLWNKALLSPEQITKKEREEMIGVYKEQMKFLDHHMADLIKKIDDDKTIIIITGDHADVFGVRGYYGHPNIFHNEMINVPLFIKLPTEMNAAKQLCKHPVSLMDLVPTILDLLGIEVTNQFDGNSLLPLIKYREDEYRTKFTLSELSRKYACVIRGNWKLIANYGDSSFELYNLEEDHGEKNNLVTTRPDIRQELEEIIKEHIIRNKPGH